MTKFVSACSKTHKYIVVHRLNVFRAQSRYNRKISASVQHDIELTTEEDAVSDDSGIHKLGTLLVSERAIRIVDRGSHDKYDGLPDDDVERS